MKVVDTAQLVDITGGGSSRGYQLPHRHQNLERVLSSLVSWQENDWLLVYASDLEEAETSDIFVFGEGFSSNEGWRIAGTLLGAGIPREAKEFEAFGVFDF